MEELFKLGLNENEIKSIYNINEYIIDEDIIKMIYILEKINCTEKHIKNIILSNPLYLSRSVSDVIELINKLDSLGITNLNIVFDSNPYLLNKDAFEIEEFINKKLKDGMILEDIVDLIDSNSYVIDEL